MTSCIYCWPWATIWSFFAAAGAVAVAIVANSELSKSRKISNVQLSQDFKRDFFTAVNEELHLFLEFDLLIYHSDNKGEKRLPNLPEELSYFEVKMKDFKRKEDNKPAYLDGLHNIYSAYEIDDYVLGNVEELGLFEEKGIMTLEFIDEIFGNYIKTVGENNEIKRYVRESRIQYNDNALYNRLENLYNKLFPDSKFLP
jgi:hypothetical protein